MKYRKLKIIVFGILAVFISSVFLLFIFLLSLFYRHSGHTVTNNTDEELHFTLLIEYLGENGFADLENSNEDNKIKRYIEEVADFSILEVYLINSDFIGLPSFSKKDIKVRPKSKVNLNINSEDLYHHGGFGVILIKDKFDSYYYMKTNFEGSTVIDNMDLLSVAPNRFIELKDKDNSSFKIWMILIILISISFLFLYLTIKNIKKYREEKKLKLKHL